MSRFQLGGELDPLHPAAGQRSVANLSTECWGFILSETYDLFRPINSISKFLIPARVSTAPYSPIRASALSEECVLSTGPPIIIISPEDTSLNMSQDAVLQCQADAYPSNLTYEWVKQGQNVYHIE